VVIPPFTSITKKVNDIGGVGYAVPEPSERSPLKIVLTENEAEGAEQKAQEETE
jgi:hypothetical protein